MTPETAEKWLFRYLGALGSLIALGISVVIVYAVFQSAAALVGFVIGVMLLGPLVYLVFKSSPRDTRPWDER